MIRKFKNKDAAQCSKIILNCIEKSLNYKNKEKNKAYMIAKSQPDKIIEKSQKIDLFVNEKNNQIVGTGGFNNGEIKTMFVLPDIQCKGFGKEMIEFLINYAKEKGFQKVFLKSSLEAEGFYRKQGFNKIKDLYEFDFHNIYMEKELTAEKHEIKRRKK